MMQKKFHFMSRNALFAIGFMICASASGERHLYVTEPGQPLYTTGSDLFSEEELRKMLRSIANHPLVLKSASLYSDVKTETKGFTLTFSKDGMKEYAPELEFVQPFINKVLDPLANAFGMLLVIVHPNSTERITDEVAIQLHRDTDVDLDLGTDEKYTPHTTTAAYLNIPEGLEGGELELFLDNLNEKEDIENGIPDAKIQPKVNTFAQFRGDALHRVLPCWVPHKQEIDTVQALSTEDVEELNYRRLLSRRVSVVFQQFRIPEQFYQDVGEFSAFVGNDIIPVEIEDMNFDSNPTKLFDIELMPNEADELADEL